MRQIMQQLPSYFDKLGLIMKMEDPVFDIENIEFCQTHPVFDGKVWRMVRNVDSSRSKDAFSLKDLSNPSVYARMLRSLGDCGMSCAYGMPVLQQYYTAMIRSGSGRLLEDPQFETGLFWLTKGLPSHNAVPITDEARDSFAAAFGISPNLQYQLEAWYDGLDLSYGGCGMYEMPWPAHLG